MQASEVRIRTASCANRYRQALWLAVSPTAFFLSPPCTAQEIEATTAPADQPPVSISGDTYGSPNLQPNELIPYGNILGSSKFRERLRDGGFGFGVYYTGEFAANATGERKDAAYAGQIAVNADLDFGKLLGATGLSAHFLALNRHGTNLSAKALGDHLTLATGIYTPTYGAKARFVYGYLQQDFDGGRISFAGGRLPFNNDFATSPLACNAVSLTAACPLPRALGNQPGYTAFPDAGWSMRGRIRLGGGFYAQTGAYLVENPPMAVDTGSISVGRPTVC